MECEYCHSTDGKESEYHPGTCAHCGAELKIVIVYGTYCGRPITDLAEYFKIAKSSMLYNPPFLGMATGR